MMHLLQAAILTVILIWAVVQLVKIPKELISIMRAEQIELFQKRKNLAEFGDHARFKLQHIKLYRKAY